MNRIAVAGTIGLLERAAELKIIHLPDVITKLRQTNFFVAPELLEAALQRDKQRHKP
jgi:predicted nucleic acid-binding protein